MFIMFISFYQPTKWVHDRVLLELNEKPGQTFDHELIARLFNLFRHLKKSNSEDL